MHVASLLRRNIRESIWRPGQRLPSLESLAQSHGVSIVTLRQAVILLEEEGLLQRLHGKGTYVTHTAGAREWLRLATTWQGILKFYSSAEHRLDTENLATAKLSSMPGNLQLGSGAVHSSAYRYLRRVHRINGLPYAVSNVYIDEKVFRRAPGRFERNLALPVIDSLSPPVVNEAHQLLLLSNADMDVATNINVPVGSTVAEIHRCITDFSNKLVYYSVMYYRGDLIQIESRLK
jgi:GntR family transcriptional regulator